MFWRISPNTWGALMRLDTANRWPSSLKLLYKDGYREGYIVAFLPDNKAVFVPSINGHANPEQWEIISLEVSE